MSRYPAMIYYQLKRVHMYIMHKIHVRQMQFFNTSKLRQIYNVYNLIHSVSEN